MRAILAVFAVCALGLGLGCGASKPATGSTVPTDNPATVAGSLGQVVLLEPGAAPQAPLRYTLAAAPQAALLDISLRVEGGAGGQGAVVSPTVRFGLRAQPGAADGEAIAFTTTIVSASVLEDASLPAARRQQLATELQSYVGLTVETVTTSRGFAKEALFELPDNVGEHIELVMETLQASLGTLAIPLPEEAVGPGARWQVRSVVPGAVPMMRTSTYTLVSADASSAVIEIALSYGAPAQPLPKRGQRDGSAHELLSLEGTGSGRATLRWSELLPTSAVTFSLQSVVRITRQNTANNLQTAATFDLSLSPAEK